MTDEEEEPMTWKYSILEVGEEENKCYQVCETYSNGWRTGCITPTADSPEELRDILIQMLNDVHIAIRHEEELIKEYEMDEGPPDPEPPWLGGVKDE